MIFNLYHPHSLEPWDWRSPDEEGIGGSELAIAETAKRLAKRGHDVRVFARIKEDTHRRDPDGAYWYQLQDADFRGKGIWYLSRCPYVIDNFTGDGKDQKRWLVCHDIDYPPGPRGITPVRSAQFDAVMGLCQTQLEMLATNHPELQGRLRKIFSGIRTELIPANPPPRDPFKLIYSSSPDRGLLELLEIYKRAKEREPRLNLTVTYGWNYFDILTTPTMRAWADKVKRLLDQDGVTMLGRIPQAELYREFMTAGIWCYPTNFTETNCITCMEAQALGAIPLTNPYWALKENVQHGILLEGFPGTEPLTKARYTARLLHLAGDHKMQEAIRSEMMPWARKTFDWERAIDQFEEYAEETESSPTRVVIPRQAAGPHWSCMAYMLPNLETMRRLGFNPRRVLDLGAAYGHFVALTKHVWPAAEIVAVEACAECAPMLEPTEPSEIHYACLSDKIGSREFFYIDHESSGAGYFPENTPLYKTKRLKSVVKPTTTVDSMFFGRTFDLMKLDTQGSELDILKSAANVLHNTKVVIIELSFLRFCEGAPLIDDVMAFMRERNFRLWSTCGPVEGIHVLGSRVNQIDGIFVNTAFEEMDKWFEVDQCS